MNIEEIGKNYFEALNKRIEVAQENNDIPETFVYNYNEKVWVMTLPHSVMRQKQMLHLRSEFLTSGSFEAEETLIKAIAQNTQVNKQPVNIDLLSMGEIEVMKTAYMDNLLLPLFLGSDKAVVQYMQEAAATLK